MEQTYNFSIKWLSVSCFEIHCGDTAIVTDPYITDCEATDLTWESVEQCNMILLSHGHSDHITDIPPLVEKFHPLILCGEQTAMPMAKWLNYTPTRIYPIYPNLELDFGDVKVTGVYGRHTDLLDGYNDLCEKRLYKNEFALADPGIKALQGIGSLEYRNFLLTLPNGTKVLLWGNDPTIEQVHICKTLAPDIAIIQNSSRADVAAKRAELAALSGAKVLIPHHHDFRQTDDPSVLDNLKNEFLKRVPDGTFIVPKHGEWIHL